MQVMSPQARSGLAVRPINQVLRNTYLLMSMMLGLSAVAVWYAINSGAAPLNKWLFLAFLIGMPYLIYATRKSVAGLGLSFVYAALLGYFLGPIIGMYARINPNIPMYAFAGTAIIFGAMTATALLSKRDFSFMRGFLVVGTVVAILAIVANMFFQIALFSVIISSVVVVLASLWILYSTQQAVNGGEDNYVVLATGLFSDIWVLFMHLMNLLNFFGGD